MDVFPASDVHPQKDTEPLVSSNGWAPELPLVGQYWVEITNEGQGFNIHGLQDDGTGEQTHWVMDEKGSSDPDLQRLRLTYSKCKCGAHIVLDDGRQAITRR